MRRVINALLTISLALGMAVLGLPVTAQEGDQSVPPPVTQQAPDSPPTLTPGVSVQTPQPETPTTTPSIDPVQIEIEVPPIARTVSFLGNTVLSSEELLSLSRITPGQIVTEQVLTTAISNIEDAYQERGYIAAVVDLDLPEAGQVGALVFHIAELRITGVRIEGLTRVREDIVRRVLTVRPGELYNQPIVVRDIAQLQRLGVFEAVAYNLEPDQVATVTLVWRLEELAQFNYAEIGGSYSPRDNVIGTAQVTFGNLFGRAQRLSVLAEIASIETQFGGVIRYYNPWIAPQNTSLLIEGFSVPRYRFSRDVAAGADLDRYFERRTGFRGIITRIPQPFLTLAAGLRFESVDVQNLPTDILTTTSPQDTDLLLASLRSIWDRRNSLTSPTSGTLTTAFIEGGASRQEVLGTGAIVKAWGDQRWFVPLGQVRATATAAINEMTPVFAVRTMLGGSAGDLPFSEQYFVGGIGDLPLRGYLEDRYWGKYVLLANLEYRRPLNRALAAVAFLDVGHAWGSDFQFEPGADAATAFTQQQRLSPKAGVGIGVRYATPVGPLRLDFAYGDSFRTHFAVGQVF